MATPSDIGLNPSELAEFYTKYFRYFNTLNAQDQQRFLERSLRFISEKEITGANGFSFDNRVKALVAASAVQLTLGLDTWMLDYFETIELHASDFDNETQDVKFSGETNLRGYIKLSWKSFLNGYKIPDDNVNLGLHEFSHALRFNGIRGNDQDYFVEHYFNKWLACAYDAYNAVKRNQTSIFRKYGGANINEFLSVCIEHYFESPQEIKENYPVLYYATGILLNQQPDHQHTRTVIRDDFFKEQSNHLPGFENEVLHTSFLKHWSFKLCLFVVAVALYTVSANRSNPVVMLALSSMPVAILLWYCYTATTIKFQGREMIIEKGTFLFKKRKSFSLYATQLISCKMSQDEWIFTCYGKDTFFHEEKVSPPKGVKEAFLAACRQNKIAVLE